MAQSPNPPDLILLDIMMPGIDGYQVCKQLKENEATKDIPVIFLTAKDEEADETKGFQYGAVDYITKPFSPCIVKARIKTHLSLVKAQKSLKLKNGELNDLNATKDKFFSIVAHDLKSPIVSFLAVSNLLAENMSILSRENLEEMAKNTKKSGDYLFKLLENLLDWARIQMNHYEFKPVNVPLNHLIQDTFYILKLNAEQKGVSLINQIDESISIMADADMLNTIVLNLISNAIKFTNNGDNIILQYQEIEQKHLISVSDTGVGMTEKQLGKLFNLGVSSISLGTANEKGTGLGLILCQEMIEKHHGEIKVESQLGKGTIFTFTIDKNLSEI